MGRNTIAILIAARLHYLLITVMVIPLKKFLLVIHKILRLFVYILTVNEKRYVDNRDNLTQQIQMQLSENKKTFSGFFFFAFLKSILNFKHLANKKMFLVAYVFLEIPAPKNMVR